MSDAKDPAAPPGGDEAALPEGEETAPAGTRAAAVVRWGLVGLMAFAAAGAWIHHVATSGPAEGVRARFRCPMHPNVVAERRGECPVCGMDLVPALADAGPAAASPAVPAAASAPAAPSAAPLPAYVCPMHPGFGADDPRIRCPECGMKLVPRSADAPAGGPGPPGAVSGLAAVELSAERMQLMGMRTAVAAVEPLAASLRTTGVVTAAEKALVSVSVRFPAWIESVRAGEVGQLVEAGQVLATAYGPDALSAQQQFLATVRWSAPRAPGAPPDPTRAQADVARDARLRLELLGFAPQDVDALAAAGTPSAILNVRAPVRGYVARRAALRGAYVQPGTELFQIADLSRVWVIADVHESEIGRVKAGQRAEVEFPAYPGERFAGRATFVYPALAAGSRTLQVRVELDNKGLRLRPGMFGDVTLALAPARAVVVPAEAVVDTGDDQYVFVSRGNGRFEPRRVRRGWSGGGKVAVLEGLAEGERVVTTANFLLDSESRLRAALEGFTPR